MKALYDTRCYELASTMLEMVMTQNPTETHRKELAVTIQAAIDDYLETLQAEIDGGDDEEKIR